MAITENLDTYLTDFGVAVVAGAVSGLGILSMPDEVVGEFGVSTEYSVIVKTSLYSSLKYGDSITVNSVSYTVKENRKIDDGSFSRISLEKP